MTENIRNEARLAHRHNLPRQLNRFVGREPEISHVRELLDSTNLLTLTGAAGCGKTRLALELASAVVDDYPDGVWLVELAPLTDPGSVAERLLTVLTVPEASGRPPLDLLTEHCRDRRALIVLDNCEHIVDACAVTAEALVRQCADLRILATSREALSIPGEVVWRVPSLRLPDAGQRLDLKALSDCEALALFIDRARAVEPDFALTAVNADAVALVCTRLDGIPLAIELAAARIRLMPPHQILSRLNDRFRLLTTGSRTALPRQQTLRASVEWSYGLLSESEQVLFRRLGAFAGSFALDAIERICSGDGLESGEVLDLLGRLEDKSVLIAEKEAGLVRFRLLETLRQYGRERLLAAGELETTERRHCDYYLALSEAAQGGVHGLGQAAWLERLEEEHDNLQRALTWCAEHDLEVALRMTVALCDFWIERGHLGEGRSWVEAVLGGATDTSVSRAKALLTAGNLAYHQADYQAAKSYLEESLAIWQKMRDRRGEGWTLVALGTVANGQGDVEGCLGPLEEGLRLCREAQDADGVCRALFQLGMVAAQQGQVDEAERLGNESRILSQGTGDLMAVTRVLHHLAVVAFLRRDYATLRALSEEGLLVSRNVRSPTGIALGLERFAVVAETEQRHHGALKLAGAATAIREAARAGVGAPWLAAVAQILEPARRALGADKAAAAWNEGTALTMEQAVGYALGSEWEEAGKKKAFKGHDPFILSRREQAIAALVAEGLTNRQIAAKLFIAKRTAETHMQHIFNKLGFSTRAQVAAWAVRQQLIPTRAE